MCSVLCWRAWADANVVADGSKTGQVCHTASDAVQVGGSDEVTAPDSSRKGEYLTRKNIGKCDLFPSFPKTLCDRH